MKIMDISNWGALNVGSNGAYFYGCANLVGTATDALNLSGTTDIYAMFYNASSFNGNISGWDTSGVTGMNSVFHEALVFNQSLNNWNVSSVINMAGMFSGTSNFNGNISGWDVHSVLDMNSMFNGANKFNQPLNGWDTSKVVNMNGMFVSAYNFNQNLSNWNTSLVTTMSWMFTGAGSFNQSLSNWDTSSVIDMRGMFYYATNFSQNLSNWDTSSVTNMYHMFAYTDNFNGSISTWDTSSVTDMSHMFKYATSFNQNLSNWNTSSVTTMIYMFFSASNFSQNLSNWDTSSVTDMNDMFAYATNFDGNLSNWDTSSVIDMTGMFASATNFNQNLSNWDTSSVATMISMFTFADSFNGNISTWNTSSVTNMSDMFKYATSFNQNLSKWDVSKVTTMAEMFYGVTLTTANYDSLLNGWASLPSLQQNVTFGGGNSKYSFAAASSRDDVLVGVWSWVITDGGIVDETAPQIEFVVPTRADGNITSDTSIEVNVTINESNLREVEYNWNGTNFSLMDDSLILMMNFDNISALGENDTYVVDVSGKGNDGVVVGGSTTIVDGKFGRAMDFDGVDDYILDDDGENYINGLTAFTLSLWVKSNEIGTDKGIVIAQDPVGADNVFTLRYDDVSSATGGNDVIKAGITVSGVDQQLESSENIQTTGWQYIVLTWSSGGQLMLYVDGVLDSPTANSVAQSGSINGATKFIIGRGGKDAYSSWNGSIDEVRIWNRSLSASEVNQMYMSNLNKYDSDKWLVYVNQSENATAGLEDGSYSYEVFAGDEAGNWNSTGERGVSVDTTNPVLNVFSPANITYSSSVIWFNATSDSIIDTWIVDYDGVNITLSGINTSLETEQGAHHLLLWANDSAGNFGLNDSIYFTVDANMTFLINDTTTVYGWLGGEVENLSYNISAGGLVLTGTNTSGNFTSQVFDVGSDMIWNNISWEGNITNQEGGNDANTVLLIHSDTTNGSTIFNDSSGSAHIITANGDVYHNVTNPKFGASSIYFDGTGDYLGIPAHDDWNFDDQNYTIDLWFYGGGIAGETLFSKWGASGNRWAFYYGATDKLQFYADESGWIDIKSSITNNEWHHLAWNYNGDTNTSKIYIDGILELNYVYHVGNNNYTLEFGGWNAAGGFSGYLDEIRMSKGIIRWDDNFTVPNVAYYNDINSVLNFSIRSCNDAACSGEAWNDLVNDTSPQNLNLGLNRYFQYMANFTTTDSSYSPELYNVSVGFSADTTAPTVSLNSPVDVANLSATSFSFNCSASDDVNLTNVSLYGDWSGGWHLNETNISGLNNSDYVFNKILDAGSYVWNCYGCDESGNCGFAGANYSLSNVNYNMTFLINDTTTVYGWLGGEVENLSYNISAGGLVLTGTNTSGNFTSQVFDVGSDMIWNNISWEGNITNQEGGNDANTVLLIHSDTTNGSTIFNDSSGSAHIITANGDVYHNVTNPKFGASSIYFDGTGDYLGIPAHDDWNFDDQNYTIDLWFYGGGIAGETLFSKWGASGNRWAFYYGATDKLQFYADESGWIDIKSSITNNEWHHLAWNYNGDTNTSKIYIDGILELNYVYHVGNNNYTLEFGGWNAAGGFSGYLDEIRMSKGIIRWDDNFTVPNVAYYNDINSVLNFSIRSCNDAACSGEAWNDLVNDTSPQNLNLGLNRYFQYMANFTTTDSSYSPELYNVSVGFRKDVPPNNVTPILISTDGLNLTSSDLNCSSVVSDPDGDDLNVSVRWYKDGTLNLTIDYNNSYSNATLFSSVFGSGNTSKGENWSCGIRVSDGLLWSGWGNSSGLIILNSLPTVSLISPSDWSSTNNRSLEFNWSSNDADGDNMTYEINISEHFFSGDGTCNDNIDNNSIDKESYIPLSDLKCLYDHGYYYDWLVRANDGTVWGNWTSVWHVNVTAEIVINLSLSSINFGSLGPGDIENTSDGTPASFVIDNDGNVLTNVSLNSSGLWNKEPTDSSYYQFKVNNVSGEEGAFDWLRSIVDWFNMPINGKVVAISKLNYINGNDSAKVDILLKVPVSESPGVKNATIIFIGELAE